MIDTTQLLDKLMGSGMAGGLVGSLAGGALTGLLANKQGRKMAGSALKVGGVALAGGLAYKAYQSYRQSHACGGISTAPQQQTTIDRTVDDSAFIPPYTDTLAQDSLSLLLLRAMIAAAKADGHIDGEENRRIFAEIGRLGLTPEEKSMLLEEYACPLNINALVADVDSPEHAAEVYAVSLMVLDTQSPQEQRYLRTLAEGLKLEPDFVRELHTAVADSAV